jgi:hypothetical protein
MFFFFLDFLQKTYKKYFLPFFFSSFFLLAERIDIAGKDLMIGIQAICTGEVP